MKHLLKKIILTTLLVSSILPGMAQEQPKRNTLGIKAGYVINHFDYEDASIKAGLKNSFIVGMFDRQYFTDKLYIQAGINYTTVCGDASIDTSVYLKDAKIIVNDAIYQAMTEYQQYAGLAPYLSNVLINQLGLGTLNAELKINTINIPLMLGYQFTNDEVIFGLHGGVAADIFASHKTSLKGSFANILGRETVDFDLNKIHIGAQLGLSIEVKHWIFDISGYYGLSKLFNGNGLKIHQNEMTTHFKPYITNIINSIVNQYSSSIPELQDLDITDAELDAITEEFYRTLSEMDTGDLTKAHRYCFMFTVGYKL